MGIGIRGMDDLVEKLLYEGDSGILEAAEILTAQGKDPETILPVVDQISRNRQIWEYDLEGNMEGQGLGMGTEQAAPSPGPSPSASQSEEGQRAIGQLAGGMDVTGQALAEYLKADAARAIPQQKYQYAGGATVGNASPAKALTPGLFQGSAGGQPAPVGLAARLRGVGNG